MFWAVIFMLRLSFQLSSFMKITILTKRYYTHFSASHFSARPLFQLVYFVGFFGYFILHCPNALNILLGDGI